MDTLPEQEIEPSLKLQITGTDYAGSFITRQEKIRILICYNKTKYSLTPNIEIGPD